MEAQRFRRAAAALSAPRTIALLSAIKDGGWYLASQAAANAGMHVSTATKHLSRLHGAGVLERRRVRTATGVGYVYRLPRPSISLTLQVGAGEASPPLLVPSEAAAALSVPRAIALLSAIKDGGWYLASQAAANAGMHVSTATKHLSRLHGAGVLERRQVRTATGHGYAYRLPRPSISLTLELTAVQRPDSAIPPFDGVIDIERVREGDRIVRKIGVPAMRGVSMAGSKYVAFELEAARPAPARAPAEALHGTVVAQAPETAATPAVSQPPQEQMAPRTDRSLPDATPSVATPPQIAAQPTEPKAAEPRAQQPQAGETVKAAATAKKPRLCPSCGATLGESDEFCYRCGVDLPRGGDPKIAALMRAFDAILATDSRNLDALFAKGAALAQMERHEEAIRALNEVTRLELRYPGVWFLKAKVYARLGKPKMAESCRQRAIELHGQERLSEVGPPRPPPAPTGAPRPRDRPPTTPVPRRVPAGAAKPRLAPGKASTKRLTQPAVPLQAGRTAGFTNGAQSRPVGLTSGRTNGLVNGRGRTNGLVNGRGRTNGLVNGRGRTNGLVNGRGRTNGLVNGRGRTNGLVNGFTSARAAIADGLTNGAGFTNGFGGARFPRDIRAQRWKLAVIPVIAFALLILPLMAPEDAHGGPIAIDGKFQDWGSIVTSQYAPTPTLNPNIDIVRFGITMDSDRIFVYVEVRGIVLAGGGADRTMDAVRVFLDIDGTAATGYGIDGWGADRMIDVAGYGGIILEARAWEFDANRDRKDWGGWAKPTATPAGVGGPRLEAQVDWFGFVDGLAISATAHTQAWDGQVDATDAAIAPTVGTLLVTQEPIAPEVLAGSNVTLLRLTMTGVRMPVTFDGLTVQTLGTAGPLAGTLRLLDAGGSELSEHVASTSDVEFTFTPQTVELGSSLILSVVGDFLSTTGETFGVAVPSPSAIQTVQGIVSLRSLPGRSVGYVGAIPVDPRVDGGFAEWTGSPIDPSGDEGGNANIDLRGHGVLGDGASMYVYADVTGRLFAGTMVPEWPAGAPVTNPPPQPDSDRDTVPDDVDPFPFDFDNDGTPDINEAGDYDSDGVSDYGYPGGTDVWVNTTLPATFPSPYTGRLVSVYIGPTNRPVVLGEDVLRFFLDADNRTSSGYAIGGRGADHMVEARGKDGVATHAEVFEFAGSYPGEWSWTPKAPVTMATGFRALELVLPFDASSVYVETKDFWGGADTAVPGVARSPTAPTRSLSPPFPHTGSAPNPPRTLDIGGNAVYYLLDTNHATEAPAECTTNKIAATSGRTDPANTIALSTGQSACWYLDATTGTTIPAGSWESRLDISRTDEIGAIGYKSNTGSCAASLVNCPKQLDWTGSSWGTPETVLATAGAAVENVRVIWDTATDSTLFWILVNTGANLHAYKCTTVDSCAKEDVDPSSGNDYAVTQAVGTAPERHWDAAIEASSGEPLLLYDNPAAVTNDFCYRTRTAGSSGTWSAETCFDHASIVSTNPSIPFVVLANNPGSNRIGIGGFDTTNDDFVMGLWDGSAWLTGAHQAACSTTVTMTNGLGGSVYAEDSADEFVAYCGNGADSVRECEWTSAGGWEATMGCASFDPETTAIGEDATSSGSVTGAVSSITVSHTTGSGSNRFMIVGVTVTNDGASGARVLNSVRYGGVDLTQVTTVSVSDDARVWIYRLINPASGTANVVAQFDGNVDPTYGGITMGVVTFTGVDQTTPLGTPVTESEGDGVITVAAAAAEVIFDTIATEDATSLSAGADQNQRWALLPNADVGGGGSTQPGTADDMMSWTWTNTSDLHRAHAGVPIKPATTDSKVFTEGGWREGSNSVLLCASNDVGVLVCWEWSGVSGTGGARQGLLEVTTNDGSGATIGLPGGVDWNPDQSGTADGLVVYHANSAGSLSYRTYDDGTNAFGSASTFTSAGTHRWVEVVGTGLSGDTVKAHACTSNSNFDVLCYRWTGSGAPGSEQSITADTVNEAYPYWDFALAENPSIQYDVRIEIWNKATDAVDQTLGPCLDVTTYGDDVQCLVSGVAQTTLTSDQVVRIRVAHSSAYSSIKIDYDDTDTTGDSRVTLPIPEFGEVFIPIVVAILLAPIARVWRRRWAPRSSSHRVGRGTALTSWPATPGDRRSASTPAASSASPGPPPAPEGTRTP